MGDKQSPVNIAKAAVEHAKTHQQNVVLLDTAGRLHVDEDMMQELADIKANVQVDATLLVVDAMTGQDAVNVAKTFTDKVGIDGVILTKMDGDTQRRRCSFHQGSDRKTYLIRRYGRETF